MDRTVTFPVPEPEQLSTKEVDCTLHFKNGQFAEFVQYEQRLLREGFETSMRTLSTGGCPLLDARKAVSDDQVLEITAFGPDFERDEPLPEQDVREKVAESVRKQHERDDDVPVSHQAIDTERKQRDEDEAQAADRRMPSV